MNLCWARNAKARPTFIEIIDILLPDLDDEYFEQVSFYHTVHKPLLLESQNEEQQQQLEGQLSYGSHQESLLQQHLHNHPHMHGSSRDSHSAHRHILEVHPHLKKLYDKDKDAAFKNLTDLGTNGSETAESTALSGATVTTIDSVTEDSGQPIQIDQGAVPEKRVVRFFPTRLNGSSNDSKQPTKEEADHYPVGGNYSTGQHSGRPKISFASRLNEFQTLPIVQEHPSDSSDIPTDMYVMTGPAESAQTKQAESSLSVSQMSPGANPKFSTRVADSSQPQLRVSFAPDTNPSGDHHEHSTKPLPNGGNTLANGSVACLQGGKC